MKNVRPKVVLQMVAVQVDLVSVASVSFFKVIEYRTPEPRNFIISDL